MRNKKWFRVKGVLTLALAGLMMVSSAPVAEKPTTVYADDLRASIEECLYNADYYANANMDVAVALNHDKEAMYQHWLNHGVTEGRNASMVFNAKYYLEVNPDVAKIVGNDYKAAYEHFVTTGLLEGRESSPVFSVKYYLQANTDVANAFNGDYISAAKHFNLNAIAEGRSGSRNFDYTVYRACNTDVEELYGEYIEGYYIHYINFGRAEGRTGGLSASDSGIDKTEASYRIFDKEFYLENYPELKFSVGTEGNDLYRYWVNEGIGQGQTASPVIVPEEYLEINTDVQAVFGNDNAAAMKHFLSDGILEGRTGSYEFDYTVYESCNTDVVEAFADDIVGYYAHYVKYGKAENRTAATYVPDPYTEANVAFEPADFTYGTYGDGYVCTGLSEAGFEKIKDFSEEYVVTIPLPEVSDTGEAVCGFNSDSVYDLGNVPGQIETHLKLICPDTYTVYYGESGDGVEKIIGVKLNDGMTLIGEGSFLDYTGLTKMTLPETIKTYEKQAFDGCTELVIDKLYTKDTVINELAFCGVTIKEVIVDNGYTAVGWGVGKTVRGSLNGANIGKITMAEGCTEIPADAFRECDGLKELNLPNGVTSIGANAFYMCDGLTKATLPDSILFYGSNAFSHCENLVVEKLNTADTTIKDAAFEYVTVKEVIISETFVAMIPGSGNANNGSFQETTFETITFEEDITMIPVNTFRGCKPLKEIVIPETVTTMGSGVFYACTNLEKVVLPDSLTEISSGAFEICRALTDINFPSNLSKISSDAFAHCESLNIKELCTDGLTIGSDAFEDVTIEKLIICETFKANGTSGSFGGAIINGVGFEEGMTTIPEYALRDCQSITEIIIPEGITTIGKRAFYTCKQLVKVVIPNTVTSIGSNAFRYCKKLSDLTCPSGIQIGTDAFSNCDSLENIPE